MRGLRLWGTIGFVLLAGFLTANLVWQILLAGAPTPAALTGALVATALAVTWPLISAPGRPPARLCRDCHGPAIGLREFGFCLRCGSNRLARETQA